MFEIDEIIGAEELLEKYVEYLECELIEVEEAIESNPEDSYLQEEFDELAELLKEYNSAFKKLTS